MFICSQKFPKIYVYKLSSLETPKFLNCPSIVFAHCLSMLHKVYVLQTHKKLLFPRTPDIQKEMFYHNKRWGSKIV